MGPELLAGGRREMWLTCGVVGGVGCGVWDVCGREWILGSCV